MRLKGGGHLTYCLNVHPGETWEETLNALKRHVPLVKERCCPDKPFGIGLRLSGQACEEGMNHLPDLKQALEASGCYAFTVNAFPHGAFHDTRVKETVYLPDWSDPRRRDYTLQAAHLLAGVLPEGMEGSISTVPLGYKYERRTRPGGQALNAEHRSSKYLQHLAETAQGLDRIYQQTGNLIHLGLEPEPDCVLETTGETLAFFKEIFAHPEEALLRRHLGVCLDTCHVALQFEDPAQAVRAYREAGIRMSKIQLSAALEVETDHLVPEQLAVFDDGVYFHQVTSSSGTRWRDLPDLLNQPETAAGTLRIHCHVPLDWKGGVLRSTRHTLTDPFWQEVARLPQPHLEVETYTFGVLPDDVTAGKTVEENMADECLWALKHISGLKDANL